MMVVVVAVCEGCRANATGQGREESGGGKGCRCRRTSQLVAVKDLCGSRARDCLVPGERRGVGGARRNPTRQHRGRRHQGNLGQGGHHGNGCGPQHIDEEHTGWVRSVDVFRNHLFLVDSCDITDHQPTDHLPTNQPTQPSDEIPGQQRWLYTYGKLNDGVLQHVHLKSVQI